MTRDAACVGQWALFDSLEPADHRQARAICETCPEIVACRQLLEDETTGRAQGARPSGTWAGLLLGRSGHSTGALR